MTTSAPAAAKPGAPGAPGPLGAFLAGLREPSALALSLTLALGLLPYVALTFVVDEEFLASPSGRVFATGIRDASTNLTIELLSARVAPAPHPQVYVFGASTTRNSVVMPALQSELAAALGAPVRVYGLASGLQRPVEALAMISALPPTARGVVVVGVGPPSLGYDSDHLRSLVTSPRAGVRLDVIEDDARALGIAVPPRSRNWFWDNRRYLLPRVPALLGNLVHGMPEWVAMPQHGRGPRDADVLDRLYRLVFARYRVDDAARAESMRVLGRLADAVSARPRLRLVLLEDTLNPGYRARPEYVHAVETFHAAVGPFAEARRIPFLRLQERARIGAEDFADTQHVGSRAAADRFTHELAVELAPLLREVAGAPR